MRQGTGNWVVVGVAIFAAFVLVGCAANGDVILGAEHAGSQVTLLLGQTLVIQLEGNPTTGYTWEVSEIDADFLRQVGEIEFRSDSDMPGSGGIQTLRFEGVAPGTTTLLLVYHRPWEDVDPLETFSVQVIVR